MELDASDGEIELPADLLESYGERFRLVPLEDRLVLLPIPDDPLSALREEFDGVDASPRELREEGRRATIERAGE